MKKSKILMILGAVLTFSFSSAVSADEATTTNKQGLSANDVVNTYFQGFMEDDYSAAASVSAESVEQLNKDFKYNKGMPLKNFEITEVNNSNSNDIVIFVKFTYDGLGTLPPVPYHVVLDNEQYKIKPEENVIVDMNLNSDKYNTISRNNNLTLSSETHSDSAISPQAVLSYYASNFTDEDQFNFFNIVYTSITNGKNRGVLVENKSQNGAKFEGTLTNKKEIDSSLARNPVLLNDLFWEPAEDPFERAANHIDGARSILTEIAANLAFATDMPVHMNSLVRF